MTHIIAVFAQGAMGAGVGAALSRAGARVVTSLSGRSAASVKRAETAGMTAVDDAELAAAEIVLSIVPPSEAMAFARRLAPHLDAGARKPVFADCNAVNPRTVKAIAEIVAATGAPFVDAGIIGGPPQPDGSGPAIYASGPHADRLEPLRGLGLDIRVLEGPIGAASALKMSYAGVTKGVTAVGAAMMLAATRAGAADGLRDELAQSQPALTAWFERQLPGMVDKAYRWVAEMREIAEFVQDDPAAAALYEAAARFYETIAQDRLGANARSQALEAFLARRPQ